MGPIQDGAGTIDPGEPEVPDAAVSMIYLGTDGVRGGADDVIFEVTTGEFGDYLIPGLPSGFYEADLEPSSLPAGAIPHADRGRFDVHRGFPLNVPVWLPAGQGRRRRS